MKSTIRRAELSSILLKLITTALLFNKFCATSLASEYTRGSYKTILLLAEFKPDLIETTLSRLTEFRGKSSFSFLVCEAYSSSFSNSSSLEIPKNLPNLSKAIYTTSKTSFHYDV
ncbi:Uncharacterised protein [Chlamydia trachomatis]|nr:Uncharacterised protein [Chlamydia trachomatis]